MKSREPLRRHKLARDREMSLHAASCCLMKAHLPCGRVIASIWACYRRRGLQRYIVRHMTAPSPFTANASAGSGWAINEGAKPEFVNRLTLSGSANEGQEEANVRTISGISRKRPAKSESPAKSSWHRKFPRDGGGDGGREHVGDASSSQVHGQDGVSFWRQ
jgi:hypothetical protein